nr:hypothetical protein [Lachnospiraceae bacterium]
MKITFDHLQENKTNHIAKTAETAAQNVGKSRSTKGVSGVLFGKSQEQQAYGKQTKSAQEVKDQAGLLSGEDYKNYMAVMSSTMSGEDFSSMMEEGVKPGKTQVSDAVTIMDHIKTVMAKSGVVVSGFNGSGDIPMEKLEAMAGNAAYAQSLAGAFQENDVPLTEENVTEAMKQSELATEITGLSDSVKQYLIENESELSVNDIYKAKFSAESGSHTGKTGHYFTDDMNGYFGKQAQGADYEELNAQIEKVIKEAGLSVNEETQSEAKWLLDKGMLLTGENLEKLHRMNKMEFPMTREDALSHIAQALREGKQAKDADLSRDGIYKQAAQLRETVDGISDQALAQVVSSGEVLNIRNLAGAQREIDLAQAAYSGKAEVISNEAALLHAQRTLEEVRLQMTVSANVILLKSDYSIDTAELTKLVEQLKAAEQTMNRTQGLTAGDAQKQEQFLDVMEKTTAIRQMPAAVIPKVMDAAEHLTLQRVYEEGRILESTYKKAGESYEALMTAPRADMGDRLKDAFSNIDDILQDLDFELTEDNRRSVRILAYNQMELTGENIIRVRATDADLKFLLDKMTPSATLQMIRDGINPLEETVSDLTDYFTKQDNELTDRVETFSRFLYEMEHSGQISAEERDTYMGIYRLIRQIEKGDGKAIGAIVNSGQELTFANLLSAVRTGQKHGIDQVVDDNFGLLENAEAKGTRISDQINRYYETKATGLLEMMSPVVMSQNHVTMDTTWEELMELSQTQDAPEQLQRAYLEEQLQLLRQDISAEDPVVEMLLANRQAITPDNLHGGEKLLGRRGEMFRKIKEFAEKQESADADITEALNRMTEHFTTATDAQDAYEEVQQSVNDRLEEMMLSGDMGYLDIRALSSLSKQLSLAGNLAKEENYELPAVIDGQLTSVNVRFRHDAENSAERGSVSIFAELAGGEKITAQLKLQGDFITGYMGCSDKEKTAQFAEKRADFVQKILSETGKTADINFVYSEEIKQSMYEGGHQAGKPMKAGVRDLGETERQTEEAQGRHTSAKELYQTAKAFIALLEG